MYHSIRSLLAWLSWFELIAALRGWRGLTWSPRWLRPIIGLLTLPVIVNLRRRPWRTLGLLLLSLGPALALQLLLGLWRHSRLDPQRRLFPGADGREVEAVAIPQSQGSMPGLHIRPQGKVLGAVAVIHGSGCSKSFYSWRLVDELLERGLAVLLVDIDGHGENARPQSWPGIEENPIGAVTFLRERYPFVALAGYSLGGCVAANAVANGLAVDALIVQESPPKLNFGRREVWAEGLLLLRPGFFHVFADSNLYHFVRAWKPQRIRCTISTWDLIDRLDLCGSLARITVPLLLIYGGADAIVPQAQAELVRQAAPPQARFHIAPAASHLSIILDPVALKLTGEWLGDQLAARQLQVTTATARR